MLANRRPEAKKGTIIPPNYRRLSSIRVLFRPRWREISVEKANFCAFESAKWSTSWSTNEVRRSSATLESENGETRLVPVVWVARCSPFCWIYCVQLLHITSRLVECDSINEIISLYNSPDWWLTNLIILGMISFTFHFLSHTDIQYPVFNFSKWTSQPYLIWLEEATNRQVLHISNEHHVLSWSTLKKQ